MTRVARQDSERGAGGWQARVAARLGPQAGPLLRGLGAYGGAEIVTRVVRLGITIIIARRLAPAIIGDAALALTIFELVKVLEKTGTGPRIVAAAADELAITCNTAQTVYNVWTGALTAAQLMLAAALVWLFHKPVAGEMLAVLAAVYPLMAAGHVPYFLTQRAGMNGRLARINATQNIADQLLTAILLLLWPSPWAIALPKLLTAPLWLVMVRETMPWRRDVAAGMLPLGRIVHFSASILFGEVMSTLRTQGDNLIVAATLGTQALGLYYFAFNAGLGIMSSVVSAFGTVAFPLLCKSAPGAERVATLRRVIVLAALLLPAVALQSQAAPWYVPILFGTRWAVAAPLVSILCLAAVPLMATTIATAWLRANHRAGIDALGGAMICATALGGLWLGAHLGGLAMAARGLVIGQALATAVMVLRVLLPGIATPQPLGSTEAVA